MQASQLEIQPQPKARNSELFGECLAVSGAESARFWVNVHYRPLIGYLSFNCFYVPSSKTQLVIILILHHFDNAWHIVDTKRSIFIR